MVPPTLMLGAAKLSVIEATGIGVTVIVAEPVWPSLVAVIDVDPSPSAAIPPLPFTVAMALFVDAQVTLLPSRTCPAASFICAVACVVKPTITFDDCSSTLTVATGGSDGGPVTLSGLPPHEPMNAVSVKRARHGPTFCLFFTGLVGSREVRNNSLFVDIS